MMAAVGIIAFALVIGMAGYVTWLSDREFAASGKALREFEAARKRGWRDE